MKYALVINVGSSSIKFSVFEREERILQGAFENINQQTSTFWMKGHTQVHEEHEKHSFVHALEHLLNRVKEHQKNIDVIGHRVVFGGSEFKGPEIVTDALLQKLFHFVPFAPLHLPKELTGIEACLRVFKDVKQVALFDTSFHQTLPEKAFTYPIPEEFRKEGIRRYGFHGLSYEYVSSQIESRYKNVIIAHMGSGVSLCALKEGFSIDTTMGLTPLGGVVMGTRTGDLDPGILLYLSNVKEMDKEEMSITLNERSGLLGLSGISSDMHVLEDCSSSAAAFAIEIFCYHIAKQIGAYFVALSGLDMLVFTAGIGERSPFIREKICSYLKPLGVTLDQKANEKNEGFIGESGSKAQVAVIPTDEESIIAKSALSL